LLTEWMWIQYSTVYEWYVDSTVIARSIEVVHLQWTPRDIDLEPGYMKNSWWKTLIIIFIKVH